MKHTKKVHDECWWCGRVLRQGDLVLQTEMLRVGENGVKINHLKGQLYNRICLNCACKLPSQPGMSFEQLCICAPEDWLEQLDEKVLIQLYADEAVECHTVRQIAAKIRKDK